MLIKNINLKNISVSDNTGITTGNNMLLYLDAANTSSLSGAGATTWYDLSGRGWNATGFTGMTYGSSPSPYENFNGSGYATFASGVYNATYTGKTVFVAANCSGISTNTFRCMLGNGGTRNFNFYLYNNSSGQNCLHFSPGGNSGVISNPIGYTTGNWGTFAATQDTSNNYSFYYNGQLVNSMAGGAGSFSQYTAGQTERIGAGDNYWYGPISFVTVYGSTLSANQILMMHNAIRGRYGL